MKNTFHCSPHLFEKRFFLVPVPTLRGDVYGHGVGDLVPGGEHYAPVELHQLLDHHRAAALRRDVRARTPVLGRARHEARPLLEEVEDDLGLVGGGGQVDGLLADLVHGVHGGAELEEDDADVLLAGVRGEVERGLLLHGEGVDRRVVALHEHGDEVEVACGVELGMIVFFHVFP